VRQKDLTVANELSLAINFRFDEINEPNFRKFLFGTAVTEASVNDGITATPAFKVMQSTLTYGSAQIYFRTGVGKDFVYMIPKCTIRPDGSMPLTTEDWISAPMVLEVFNTTWNAANIATSSTTINAPYGLVAMYAI